MKLFALGIDFNPMDWIIGGEAKIQVAIRHHISVFFSYSSPISQNPHSKPKSPSVPYQFGIRAKFPAFPFHKIHFKKNREQ